MDPKALLVLAIAVVVIASAAVAEAPAKVSKEYNQTLQKISLKDGNKVSVASYTLVDSSGLCLRECWATGNVTVYQKSKVFDGVKFKDKLGNNKNVFSMLYVWQDGAWVQIKNDQFEPGNYTWRLVGQKPPRESMDWILSAFGMDLDEWAWWYSASNWSDDFEDASINETFWNTTRQNSANAQTAITEESGGNGYIKLFAKGLSGDATVAYGGVTLRPKYNYNDTGKYRFEFSMNATLDGSEGLAIAIDVANTTARDYTNYYNPDINSITVKTFTAAELAGPYKAFYLILNAQNKSVVLYNKSNDAVLATKDLSSLTEFYPQFRVGVQKAQTTVEANLYIVNFTATSDALNVSVASPANSSVRRNPVSLNCSATSGPALTNISLWGNWTGAWHLNSTASMTGFSNSTVFSLNISDGWYIWGCSAENDEPATARSDVNYTIGVDSSPPLLTLTVPAATESNKTLNVTIVAADAIAGLSYCNFTIMRGASTEVANTRISDCKNQSVELSGDATYTIYVSVNDTAGNLNTTSRTFTVSGSGTVAPVIIEGGGGGGGSTTIIIGTNSTWSMETDSKTASYQLSMGPGTIRSKDILFRNNGQSAMTVKLRKTGQTAEFITLESDSVTLPLLRDIPTKVPFTIEIPEGTPKGVYTGNIEATAEDGSYGIITVQVTVGSLSTFLKLTSSRRLGGLVVPYFLMSAVSMIVVGGGAWLALKGNRQIGLALTVMIAGVAFFVPLFVL